MSRLKTPDWILKGEKKPSIKKKGKTFKLRKCPECGSKNIGVVLGQEEGKGTGEWYCKSCKWEGGNLDEKELSEKEFIDHLDSEEK